MTREEHLDWCKERANEYLDRGDVVNGIASMLSDLNKHSETRTIGAATTPSAMLCAVNRDMDGARRFVNGFR